jgi:hypothetical protein
MLSIISLIVKLNVILLIVVIPSVVMPLRAHITQLLGCNKLACLAPENIYTLV